MKNGSLLYQLLASTIGLSIEIISNDYRETPVPGEINNSYHKIVFQIKEEDPDIFAIGVLFTLSLLSFTFAAPRGYSEIEFVPDEEWGLEYFVQGLEFERGNLCFSADYISGRLMKADITFEAGGRVTLETRNRGRGADRWITHLQGKRHIQKVK